MHVQKHWRLVSCSKRAALSCMNHSVTLQLKFRNSPLRQQLWNTISFLNKAGDWGHKWRKEIPVNLSCTFLPFFAHPSNYKRSLLFDFSCITYVQVSLSPQILFRFPELTASPELLEPVWNQAASCQVVVPIHGYQVVRYPEVFNFLWLWIVLNTVKQLSLSLSVVHWMLNIVVHGAGMIRVL